METNNEILDQPLIEIDSTTPIPVKGAKRFGNYLLDYLIISMLQLLIEFTIPFSIAQTLGYTIISSISIYVGYYVLLEHLAGGKTIGKFATRTRVVDLNGNQPPLSQIVGRSFCRLIPFEAFSFLGPTAVGWHDSISNTRVVEDRR